jgi:TolA-binding protein
LQAAVERETELEQRMAESNSALMRMQKIVDERNQRVTDMEHKLAMLEVECATLNQELQESQARQRREQKRPNEEAVQTAQVQVYEKTQLGHVLSVLIL